MIRLLKTFHYIEKIIVVVVFGGGVSYVIGYDLHKFTEIKI